MEISKQTLVKALEHLAVGSGIAITALAIVLLTKNYINTCTIPKAC